MFDKDQLAKAIQMRMEEEAWAMIEAHAAREAAAPPREIRQPATTDCLVHQCIAVMWDEITGHPLPVQGTELRFKDGRGIECVGTVCGLIWSMNFIVPYREKFFVKVLIDRNEGAGKFEWGVEPKDAIYG